MLHQYCLMLEIFRFI